MHNKAPFISARLTTSHRNMFEDRPTLGLSSSKILAPRTELASPYLDMTSQVFCVSFNDFHGDFPQFRVLPLSHISTLIVDTDEGPTGTRSEMLLDLWEPLASVVTNLTRLDISRPRSAKGFLGTLRRRFKPNQGSRGSVLPPPFFPKLEVLRFVDVPFERVEPTTDAMELTMYPWSDIICACKFSSGLPRTVDERCSCHLPIGDSISYVEIRERLTTCRCDIAASCDCECMWLYEGLAKLLVDVLRGREESGLPRLQRLELVANQLQTLY